MLGDSLGTVLLVFGSIALLMVRRDVLTYRGRGQFVNPRQAMHLQRMVGGYIGTVTAFMVVNIRTPYIPGVVVWLFPTVALVPLIFRWSKKYGGPLKQ